MLNRHAGLIQDDCSRGERPGCSLQPTPLQQEGGEFLRGGAGTASGHLCLLTGLTPVKSKLSPAFIPADSFTTKHPQQLGRTLPAAWR